MLHAKDMKQWPDKIRDFETEIYYCVEDITCHAELLGLLEGSKKLL